MQQYRLLRNNRETGPFAWQELIELPLKAYDLVWIDGRSSSWKYPSEVDELKPFAPVAEDDLYIRFHTPATPIKTADKKTPVSIASGDKLVQKKYVSVILPAATQLPGIGETPPPATSQPLLVENTIAYNSGNLSRQQHRYYIAGALLVLLAGGIYFGTRGRETKSQEVLAAQGSTAVYAVQNGIEKPATVVRAATPSAPAPLPAPKPEASATRINALEFASLNRHINIAPAGYHTGFFGGVSRLALTVTNTGKLPLQKVVVSVDYLLRDKSIFSTERVHITYLEAGASAQVQVPPSSRGIAFQTRVESIDGIKPK